MKSFFALLLVVTCGAAVVVAASGQNCNTRFSPPTVEECVESIQIYLSAKRAQMSEGEYNAEKLNWLFFKNSFAGYVKKYKKFRQFRADVIRHLANALELSEMNPENYTFAIHTFQRLDGFLLTTKLEKAISLIGEVLKKVVV